MRCWGTAGRALQQFWHAVGAFFRQKHKFFFTSCRATSRQATSAMHKPSIERLVYRYQYPRPRPGDPTDFHDFVRRHIIPEVRDEIIRFYGAVSCIESMYPGLDYSSRGHRLRLGQFPWHRKLFNAFDALRLTEHEIDSLCHWEGTKWAKEKYERDHNATIRDSTWDDIVTSPPRKRPTVSRGVWREGRGGSLVKTINPYGSDGAPSPYPSYKFQPEEDFEQDHHYDLSHSVGPFSNQHILPASQAPYQSEQTGMDPAWEQWIKDATERGNIPSIAELGSSRNLAAYQAHIPAHYAYATPINYYGPYSPAPPTFTPTNQYSPNYYQPIVPRPLPPAPHYSFNSYSARSSRGHRSNTLR